MTESLGGSFKTPREVLDVAEFRSWFFVQTRVTVDEFFSDAEPRDIQFFDQQVYKWAIGKSIKNERWANFRAELNRQIEKGVK